MQTMTDSAAPKNKKVSVLTHLNSHLAPLAHSLSILTSSHTLPLLLLLLFLDISSLSPLDIDGAYELLDVVEQRVALLDHLVVLRVLGVRTQRLHDIAHLLTASEGQFRKRCDVS